MPQYIFEARDESGRIVSDQLSAETVSAAIAELEGRGWIVQSIRLAVDTEKSRSDNSGPISNREPALEQQFAAALENREVLIPALTALAHEMPSPLGRREMLRLVDALQRASSSAELRRNKIAAQWLPLLVTGVGSESATQRLSDLITHTSREVDNRSNRRQILIYPFVTGLIALAVLGFLCVSIVPTFGQMFDEFGLRLPFPTWVVVSIADELRFRPVQFFVTIAGIALAIFLVVRLWIHYALSTRLFGFLFKGNSAGVSAMSSLTSRLAELLSIDVPLTDALWLAGQGCGHYYYRNVAEKLARHVHHNDVSLRDCPAADCLPANLIYALQAGEDGRPSVALLRELSAIYGERAAQRVDWPTGVIGPIAIVMLGLAVGFVVIALFMPLVSLVSGLS